MPRSTKTPTIAHGSHHVASASIAPMLLSSGWTMRNMITSVDATISMPTMAPASTLR